MEVYGAECVASPSNSTAAGRAILEKTPDSTGSLGIAISEAVEDAVQRDDTKYAPRQRVKSWYSYIRRSSVRKPSYSWRWRMIIPMSLLVAPGAAATLRASRFHSWAGNCVMALPVKVVAVEPAACPTLTRGKYAYDFGDTAHLTPLVKMHTLGSTFVPLGFHAGGLRYHGMGPLISHAQNLGLLEPRAYHQLECFEAAVLFARAEGIIPAPEASHAIKGGIDEGPAVQT